MKNSEVRFQIKKTRSRNLVYLCWCLVWLGKWFLFQTFEELDSVKDKELETRQIRQLLDTDPNMTGLEFERYVARMLRSRGYSHVRLTEKYDLGVDIIACKDSVTWGVQVKRYSGLVGPDAIRQAVTALRVYHCDKAMAITSLFSEPAQALAAANGCVLIDREGLRHGLAPFIID